MMVVDECHRGYLLDQELSETELTFRGQDDYISKYRRVLEYFDATKIGLTATPALHTTDIFGDPIYTYSYREAVIDGFLIDHEPPIRIETALTRAGIKFEKDEQLEVLDPRTGQIDLTHAPDEIRFEVEHFNKQVITEEFNRVVAEELAKHIDPALPGKTLIFAATDAHAGIVVKQIKKAFAEAYGEIDDAAVRKITGSVDRVQDLIRSFRNDANPKIAVTVDLLTTGIDVPWSETAGEGGFLMRRIIYFFFLVIIIVGGGFTFIQLLLFAERLKVLWLAVPGFLAVFGAYLLWDDFLQVGAGGDARGRKWQSLLSRTRR